MMILSVIIIIKINVFGGSKDMPNNADNKKTRSQIDPVVMLNSKIK